ncbi:hypothetical protein HU200_012666 [Digitaria exilis]|uniref:Uncharacterized protein n=1 Tax=Digitaria exilis TaxID=1010633 RepID=A0A835KLM9_9POAL|nr:hypothetical protein HU200_012666 [Digitaria exilis]
MSRHLLRGKVGEGGGKLSVIRLRQPPGNPRSETDSLFVSMEAASSSKRRRRDDEQVGGRPWRKQHLYLALDDWKGGYSIHKLDADDQLGVGGQQQQQERLPEPACPVVPWPSRCRHGQPTFVYDTETGALSGGPDQLHGLGGAVAIGERLYALTSAGGGSSFRALSWAPSTRPELGAWDPAMEWSWASLPSPQHLNGRDIAAYIRTGTPSWCPPRAATPTASTSARAMPFRGQAFFDAELDALVGLHRSNGGHVCCCPVPSRSSARRPPECKVLDEKLFRREEGVPSHRHLATTLTYIGDTRFCLVESLMPREDVVDAVLHVTFFGLKYDAQGELRTKIRRLTRSYATAREVAHDCTQKGSGSVWRATVGILASSLPPPRIRTPDEAAGRDRRGQRTRSAGAAEEASPSTPLAEKGGGGGGGGGRPGGGRGGWRCLDAIGTDGGGCGAIHVRGTERDGGVVVKNRGQKENNRTSLVVGTEGGGAIHAMGTERGGGGELRPKEERQGSSYPQEPQQRNRTGSLPR